MIRLFRLFLVFLPLIILTYISNGQSKKTLAARKWADSVFNSLTEDQRIAQLMLVRVSSFTNKGPVFYEDNVAKMITKYNIGGLVLFQGTPVQQADIINKFQKLAKTPLLVSIDGEWGLGMRYDSVQPLNQQIMLGALNDGTIVYKYGKLVAEQMRRAGIQVNFAPVVDINNNPNNPVINFRSFGEDKYKVALYGVQYMKGMQDNGILACGKHFPGHGDVAVDSHFDLPIVNKLMLQLDSLELYPFKEMIKAGVGSIMVAHLFVPAIDSTVNTATSLSRKSVTGLLKTELGYEGLIFTDALEMKGVAKFFPGGTISIQSLVAGNDMLCLPENIDSSIYLIKNAILNNQLNWEDINLKCKKILEVKYNYGLAHLQTVNTKNLTSDLNKNIIQMRKIVAENAITLLSNNDKKYFPLVSNKEPKQIAYLAMGVNFDNEFAKRMRRDYNADVFYFDYNQPKDSIRNIKIRLQNEYSSLIIGVHNYKNYPANNFGISEASIALLLQLETLNPIVFVFGNPYAIKNYCSIKNLVACYDDDKVTQQIAADFLEGKIYTKGSLPVTVCDRFPYGYGISDPKLLPFDTTFNFNNSGQRFHVVDSLVNDAIAQRATPGCVVTALKDGKLLFQKAYGSLNYDKSEPVRLETIFDLASMTKICATTLAVMKLFDEKKIHLNKTLGDYLPWTRGSDKSSITIENLLLHQGGFVPDINFDNKYKGLLTSHEDEFHNLRVADNLYISNEWPENFNKQIRNSKLYPDIKYVYSDIGMILIGEVVEAITRQKLNEYVQKEFYIPLGLRSTGFKPLIRFPKNRIAPTEIDHYYRNQQLQGDVHDPTSAFLGGVAGHAGLFSDAYDLSVIMQMWLNGGVINGHRYIDSTTVNLFTAYNSNISRRGLGFDKPAKDNVVDKNPYPSRLASPLTYGHTGYTGTAFWIDPKYNIIYIFLSNRVNPNDSNKLGKMNVRSNVQDAIYNAIGIE